MKIADISPENRPRERLALQGPESLSNAELLAIILKSGTRKENVLDMCHGLLSKYKLQGLQDATLPELRAEHGIGKAKASQLVALFELYKRTKGQKQTTLIKKARDVFDIFQARLESYKKEHFVALYLDTKNRVICQETITVGILNASVIHPREVFHGAIKNLAHSVIVVHNHPSGDPTPSEEDLQVTKRLQETGEIMGITLLDHVIIGKTYWSWKESLLR